MKHKPKYMSITICSAMAVLLLGFPFTLALSTQDDERHLQSKGEGVYRKERDSAVETAKKDGRINLEAECFRICYAIKKYDNRVLNISYSEIDCEYDEQIPGHKCTVHAEGTCRCRKQ